MCSCLCHLYPFHTFIGLSFAINVSVSVSDLNLSDANTGHTISFAAIFLLPNIHLQPSSLLTTLNVAIMANNNKGNHNVDVS